MPKDPRPQDAIRDAADEIRRETRAAGAEVRIELGLAGRETRDALREAMGELRSTLRDTWRPSGPGQPEASGSRVSRAKRKEMTRELLLDAAIVVFAEKGYHGASLDDVADEAGFTKGAVYSNFTRKSDLFRALLERETARGSQALRQAIESVPLELLPDATAELLVRRDDEQHERDILGVEFWLAAVRDPGLRQALSTASEDLGRAVDLKLASSDLRPGLSGPELAALLEALATGLQMNQALDPETDQASLFAAAVRKLLADEPPQNTDTSPDR